MPRRIDVELTSARGDGTWTWRAAGAREPKGVVEEKRLYPDAKVGDVVRAEVETDVEGIVILSVQPPKGKRDEPANKIELLGPSREFEPVTTSLVPKRGGDRDRRGPRRDGERGDRTDRGERRDRGGRPDRPSAPRGERPGERSAAPRGERDRGGDRGGRPRSDRPDHAGARVGGPAGERQARPERPRREERPERARPKRLSPGNTHRSAMLAALSPEQRPIAEQLLRGGMPAVRRAIDEQNASARAEGLPEIKPEPLVEIAEELLPRVKVAEWRDRAEAAKADVDAIGLRDLRSVVSSADVANRDEAARELAIELRTALERRVNAQRDAWIHEITGALGENRLVRALRVSARPPDPTMRFEADLAQRLAAAASEQLSADTPADRWMALLEAVAASPVRTIVKPAALPNDANEGMLAAARVHAGRIPALASLLGLALPPPPAPMRKPPRPPRPGGDHGGPPPPRPPAPARAERPPAEPDVRHDTAETVEPPGVPEARHDTAETVEPPAEPEARTDTAEPIPPPQPEASADTVEPTEPGEPVAEPAETVEPAEPGEPAPGD